MPAAAQHIRLDLQRNLLGQDGQRREATKSLVDGGEEERPALQSGLQEAGGGTGLGHRVRDPTSGRTRGTGCCPLLHCLPWARGPPESRQMLQTCPLCPLPISLCPSLLRSLSFSQQSPQFLLQCVSVSPTSTLAMSSRTCPPPPAFLPGSCLWRPAGSTCQGVTVKSLPQPVLGVNASLLLSEQTALGWLGSHSWGMAGSGAPRNTHTNRVCTALPR